ncbi:MAG TPA: hypothetical protein VHL09_12650 [Dehalococcoidia bacterium]|nr:hypothetical protein [Dehalococcoidia bacterium]
MRDIMERTPAPRAVFIDFPVGRTFGRRGDPDQQRRTLRDALAELPHFTGPNQIRDLPHQWASADRSWEQMVQDEMTSYGRR